MAVLLLRTEHGSSYSPPAATGMFSDVPANDPFAKWIEQLAREGVTSGCGGGKYCPNTAVTRGQMAAFLSKTFKLSL
jgi:S-layer homology domain